MKKMINNVGTLYQPENAERLAKELQNGDPDWTYKVEHYDSGWSAIKIYDEDGEFVADHSDQ